MEKDLTIKKEGISVRTSIDRALERSLRLLIEDPGFIGLYVLPFAAGLVISFLLFGSPFPEPNTIQPSELRTLITENIWRIAVYSAAYAISGIVLGITAQAGVILKTSALEEGGSMSFGEALRRGVKFVPKLFVASVLTGIIVVGPILISILLAILVSLKALIGVLIWILPAIYIGVRLFLYSQACVIDNLGPVECLKRAWHTSEGDFWSIFALGLVIGIVFGAISGAAGATQIKEIRLLGSLVTALLAGPVTAIAFTFVYFDLAGEEPEK